MPESKTTKISLKQMFMIVTLMAVIVFFISRPIVYIASNLDNVCVKSFLLPWQHWAWFAGFDVEYFRPDVEFTDIVAFSALLSFVTHAVLFFFLWYVWIRLWYIGNPHE